MHHVSRREFVALAAAAAAGAPYASLHKAPSAAITAQEIVDRIKANLGVEWKAETVDSFKAGDPATAATGIVTTALATIAVLRQAVKAKANLVITCEPTFYARADSTTPPARRGGPGTASQQPPPPAPDPVFAAKRDFIEKNGLVVWRFSDHWRLRRPDPFAKGLIDALGWSGSTLDEPARASTREIPLGALASHIKKKLNAQGGIRVVGDPRMNVRTIGVLPGSTPIQASLEMLPGVDAIVAGEVREWESVEYARDTVTAGGKKGLILLGRIVSEEPGMNVCAQWLKTLVPELTTTWISAGDPYWRPRS
jgi:putative NIF3 family GTP cyclohydrolase 1 type 2